MTGLILYLKHSLRSGTKAGTLSFREVKRKQIRQSCGHAHLKKSGDVTTAPSEHFCHWTNCYGSLHDKSKANAHRQFALKH